MGFARRLAAACCVIGVALGTAMVPAQAERPTARDQLLKDIEKTCQKFGGLISFSDTRGGEYSCRSARKFAAAPEEITALQVQCYAFFDNEGTMFFDWLPVEDGAPGGYDCLREG